MAYTVVDEITGVQGTFEPLSEHPKFVELCAAFSWKAPAEAEPIRRHAATCVSCREKVEAFLADGDSVMGDLSDLVVHQSQTEVNLPWDWNATQAEQKAMGRSFVNAQLGEREEFSVSLNEGEPLTKMRPSNNGHNGQPAELPRRMNAELRRILLPAAAVLFAACAGTLGYWFGFSKANHMTPPAIDSVSHAAQSNGPELQAVLRDREELKRQLADRDASMARLAQRIKDQHAEIERLTQDEQRLETTAQRDEATRQGLAAEKEALNAKLDSAQSELASTQDRFTKAVTQSEELTAALKNRNATIRDQDQTIQQQQDLLANDRDIRDLITARNLYVAEVFDLDKYAQIKRPYARVFFTKEKSLIFYGYDLDQQQGVRNASFQAWGNRGHDRNNALNLGFLYLDSAENRRWVLKLDDPETLRKIDAIFITVEPKGGSAKPTGKSVLFASLRLPPNHP